ncbi:MAG: hypothetical protein LBF28_01120 [Rickettsiales bacterium]|jgi:hypothetical protein|nr:hypothetical protein [Rickettsiales bacterium]
MKIIAIAFMMLISSANVFAGCLSIEDMENMGVDEFMQNFTKENILCALRGKAESARLRENSAASKLLGGAAMAASGIWGKMLMEGMAEKKADEASERDMAAYLATFTCDFGQGRNIKGGEKEIILPGGNDMISLYAEYKKISADLKAAKEALGLNPGIESETVLDKADAGLYGNRALGKTEGAFTSVSRALSDPAGRDASEWDAQKSGSANRAKTGGIVAGAGLLGAAVGNLAVNGDN